MSEPGGLLAKLLADLRDELLRQIDIKASQYRMFKVATTAPDFTVYLAGGSEPVAALQLSGASYSVGDRGVALVTNLCPPICLKTV